MPNLNQIAAIFLLFPVVGAGCLGESGNRPQVTSGPNRGTSDAPPIDIGPIPDELRSTTGLNITGCKGLQFHSTVPTELLVDDLPKSYKPLQAVPGATFLMFRASMCEKAAVYGVDVGRLSFLLVGVAVSINGNPLDQALGVPTFVFEWHTDNAAFAGWLTDHGLKPLASKISLGRTNIDSTYQRTEGSIASSAGPLYEWIGPVYPPIASEHEKRPFIFGADPSTDFIQQDGTMQVSRGTLEASMRFAPESGVSKILSGMLTSRTSITSQDWAMFSISESRA